MNHEYKIGKVSKVTGISPDTLRVWERRYAVVEPGRTDAGGRLYSVEDVARLKLIKQLIDGGDSIGNIAALEYDQLKSRMEETREQISTDISDEPLQLTIIGSTLPAKFARQRQSLRGLEIVADFPSLAAFISTPVQHAADILVIEMTTIHKSTVIELTDLIGRLKLLHTFVTYRFATSTALDRLTKNNCTPLHAPLSIAALNDICVSVSGARQQLLQAESKNLDIPISSDIPRKFDDETLDKIAAMTPVIKCECPQHLAELLANLSAFEQYSSECESRNAEDAELHAYLSSAAGQARSLVENALVKVLEIENIKL